MKCLEVVSLSLLGLSMGAGVPLAASYKAVPPGETVEGKTMSEFAAEWWKWVFSAPEGQSLLGDDTGRNCAVGQKGPVWFLAGGFKSSTKERRCEVPAGKYLLLPVLNRVAWRPRPNKTFSCEDAKRQAAFTNERMLDLFVEIDGSSLADVKRFRARTDTCFNVNERIPSGVDTYDAYPSAADGYWIMLEPLSEGRHSIRFGGRLKERRGRPGEMFQDIKYELTIK